MKSPITGKEMIVKTENTVLSFRKEEFDVVYHFYYCEDAEHQFTDDRLDNLNMFQVYNQYREKHGIPYPEQIKSIREKYKVSANKMSKILGLGANSFRLYESGEMPSVAIGRLILVLEQPEEFIKQVRASSNTIEEKELNKLITEAEHVEEEERINSRDRFIKQRVFFKDKPQACTGYVKPSYEKTNEVISFFSTKMVLPKTKLNKLLFYADFYMYRSYGQSITGNTYRAVDYGPVPSNYGTLYAELTNDGLIESNYEFYESGGHCERLKPTARIAFNNLSEKEIEILEFVADKFKNLSPNEIVKLSHEEPAWIDNIESKGIVSYQKYAFNLKGM